MQEGGRSEHLMRGWAGILSEDRRRRGWFVQGEGRVMRGKEEGEI